MTEDGSAKQVQSRKIGSGGGLRRLNPPETIGIIGGGQLGRMLAVEAKRMGYRVVVLDPDSSAPAGQVADWQIVAGYSELEALRTLARETSVLTYEFEHLEVEVLKKLEAEGAVLVPSAKTLGIIQDKYVQKQFLKGIGIPVPGFSQIGSLEALEEAFQGSGGKLVLKTRRHGYDGKGTRIITDRRQIEAAYKDFEGAEIMVEDWVDHIKEISVLVARGSEGQVVYPIAENVHVDGILMQTAVPAELPVTVEQEVKETALKIVEAFEDVGLFCIEFFVDGNFNIYVNEIAPRPHNSGHYSIEACVTSQFEQLLRVMTGMPLGSTAMYKPCIMLNLLGKAGLQGDYRLKGTERLMEEEACYLHLYGKKETSPLRKLGHVTVLDESVSAARLKAERVMKAISVEGKERV